MLIKKSFGIVKKNLSTSQIIARQKRHTILSTHQYLIFTKSNLLVLCVNEPKLSTIVVCQFELVSVVASCAKVLMKYFLSDHSKCMGLELLDRTNGLFLAVQPTVIK